MGTKQALTFRRNSLARSVGAWLVVRGRPGADVRIGVCAGLDASRSRSAERQGFFAAVSRWFSQQIRQRELVIQGRAQEGRGLQQEAGAAAKSTVEGAKDAAGAVARIPNVRTVSGHEKCQVAPNGAPDCVAAANTICKAKGFDSGRSLDMTTAEVCPAQSLDGRTIDRARVPDRNFCLAGSLSVASPFDRRLLVPRPCLCFRRVLATGRPLNLHAKLLEREAAGRPVTVAVIGAGKFGTMFLSQARLTQGMHRCRGCRSRRRSRTESVENRRLAGRNLCRFFTGRCT